MPKKPTPAATIIDTPMNEVVLAADIQAHTQLAQLTLAANEKAQALAVELGYDGALSQGALEDEIRFYQQRTVECLLETGKRLLILKEMTLYGEFEQRVELLGFAGRTARRFMAAAQKAGKSATVAVLAGRSKNQKAFLELITHDDDVIENLAELDDFDRMSASQLRAAARELTAESKAAEQLLADKNAANDKLKRQLQKHLVAATDWPEAFKVLMDQAQFASKNIKIQIGSLVAVGQEALKPEPKDADEEASLNRAREALAEELLTMHRSCAQMLEQAGMLFHNTLGSFASEGLYQ